MYKIGEAFETDGLRNGEPIYCPIGAYGDCPYCDQCNICHITDPITDCDDFNAIWESWEQYDSENEEYEYEDDVDETGFNPYEGAYDYDC